jgi:hypothetical protein
MIEVQIANGNIVYSPAVEGGITWETARAGEPGCAKFTCLQDSKLNISEGNAVKLIKDGTAFFFGFIFTIKRDKSNQVQITAYDQLRYLKNKDTYVLDNRTADLVIYRIILDFGLKKGTLASTKYKLTDRVEDNKTLFDIIQGALDETLRGTYKLYVLYDDVGKLMLKNVEDMKLNILIDASTGQTFDYTSSINDNTYNQVKLMYDNEETGTRDVYISKDSENINKWGVLQYFEKMNAAGDFFTRPKADKLLRLYNAPTKTLKVNGAFGDIRVRAGSSVIVKLDLEDMQLSNYMLVEKVKHKFDNGLHTMDLTLRGGDINSA